MYPSPLRDGGYDIADFYGVHPDYGTIDDVRAFIEAAHERGIRVIADLVMNHTSSDHAWFQEARSSPDNPKRDWYVWSDDPTRYDEARIIFVDTETSNWTWDEKAGAYYWHRFFHHQPDLNYDNPEVQRGDARRPALLAGPRPGRLPPRRRALPLRARRHELREPRRDARVPQGRARDRRRTSTPTASCSPRPTSGRPTSCEYFGDGDECHMAFHFPVMPRMFMALRREEADADPRDPRPDAAHPGQLPVGPVPAQPRRADARDGHRRGARLHVRRVRQGPADEAQPRHPPAPRAAAGRRPRRDRADARDPLQPAGLAGPVLRRRDRDGRQRLPRRPRRRAHADAVDRRPQRRLQPRGLRPALRAAADGPRLRLPGRQRRGPAAHADARCCAGCGASSRCARSTPCSASAPSRR